MRKLGFALVFASSFVAASASADGPTTATFVNTQVSSTNCPPGSAPGQLGYKCSIPKAGASASLALRTPSNTTLPDGRIVQLVLQDIIEPANGVPRRFRVVASHKPAGGAAFIALADITVKQGEAIHFRFPYGGIPTDGLLVDITLAK
jgi:hypothetical protein